jgi:hypothetical protein
MAPQINKGAPTQSQQEAHGVDCLRNATINKTSESSVEHETNSPPTPEAGQLPADPDDTKQSDSVIIPEPTSKLVHRVYNQKLWSRSRNHGWSRELIYNARSSLS